jgi:hypothetical protein
MPHGLPYNCKGGELLRVIRVLEVALRVGVKRGVGVGRAEGRVLGEGVFKLHDNSLICVHIIRLPTR